MGRRRFRWDDNIKMYIQEIGWMCVDRSHLAHYRDKWRGVVNTVVKLRVPQKAMTSCGVGIVFIRGELGKLCVMVSLESFSCVHTYRPTDIAKGNCPLSLSPFIPTSLCEHYKKWRKRSEAVCGAGKRYCKIGQPVGLWK